MSPDTREKDNREPKPHALDYASGPRRQFQVSRLLRHPLFWIALVLAFIFACHYWQLYDWGSNGDICTQCGAHRYYEFIEFGITVRYGDQTIEGPISKRIQAYEEKKCKHKWETACRKEKWVRATYRDLFLYHYVKFLETYPSCDSHLDRRIKADPEFMRKLIQAVRSPYENDTFWDALKMEAMEEFDEFLETQKVPPPVPQKP